MTGCKQIITITGRNALMPWSRAGSMWIISGGKVDEALVRSATVHSWPHSNGRFPRMHVRLENDLPVMTTYRLSLLWYRAKF